MTARSFFHAAPRSSMQHGIARGWVTCERQAGCRLQATSARVCGWQPFHSHTVWLPRPPNPSGATAARPHNAWRDGWACASPALLNPPTRGRNGGWGIPRRLQPRSLLLLASPSAFGRAGPGGTARGSGAARGGRDRAGPGTLVCSGQWPRAPRRREEGGRPTSQPASALGRRMNVWALSLGPC